MTTPRKPTLLELKGICKCGHRQIDHADIVGGLAIGHGGCLEKYCACLRFTWVRYTKDLGGVKE